MDDELDLEGLEDDLDEAPPSVAETIAEYRDEYELTDQEATALERFLVAIDAEELGTPVTDPELLRAFAHALVNPLFSDILAIEAWRRPAIKPFAERLLTVAEGADIVGVRYVLANVADMDDEPDLAEQHLRTALAADPQYAPALVALADLEEERGDLAETLRLLTAAGLTTTDPRIQELEQVLTPRGPKVGRNDPCPCGSGRKSKTCHPDGIGTATPTGASLLRWIVGTWAERPSIDVAAHDLMEEAGFDGGHELAEDDEEEDDDAEVRWQMAHGLAVDIVLFDEGELAGLVARRAHRLSPDLQLLLETWVRAERTLLEVRAVEPGRSLTVRDLLTDQLLTLADPSHASGVRLQDLLCARPLPDGQGSHLIRDGFKVSRADREAVLDILRDGDIAALLTWLSGGDAAWSAGPATRR